jgi:ABC-type glycerol-3-phosphate transport system substrate-binding protein
VGLFADPMKHSKVFAFVVAVILLAVACGSKSGNKATIEPKPTPDPLVGEWVNAGFKAQTMVITKTGETYILELRNSQMPDLNQKFAARFKDNVIHLDGAQMKFFYDPQSDRISGNFGLGNEEFKRKK